MKAFHFLSYRYNAYQQGLSDLFEQIKQFGLMVVLLFYTAIPGLFLLAFFWLGKVVQVEGQENGSMFHAWSLLVLQTVIIGILKPAILDTKHRTFQHALVHSRVVIKLADFALMLLSHVPFWMSMYLALSMEPNKLNKAPQFIAFLALQIGFGYFVLHHFLRVLLCLIIGFGLLWIAPTALIWSAAIALCLLILTVLPHSIRPKHLLFIDLTTSQIWQIWVVWALNNVMLLLWRVICCVVIIASLNVVVVARPDLEVVIAPLSLAICLFIWGSLIFTTKPVVQDYVLYWRSINKENQVYRQFFFIHTTILAIVWWILFSYYSNNLLLPFYLPSLFLFVWSAWRSARLFAVLWCTQLFLVYLIYEIRYLNA